jgi:hypothetical protein
LAAIAIHNKKKTLLISKIFLVYLKDLKKPSPLFDIPQDQIKDIKLVTSDFPHEYTFESNLNGVDFNDMLVEGLKILNEILECS